jgi:hypothetical protein
MAFGFSKLIRAQHYIVIWNPYKLYHLRSQACYSSIFFDPWCFYYLLEILNLHWSPAGSKNLFNIEFFLSRGLYTITQENNTQLWPSWCFKWLCKKAYVCIDWVRANWSAKIFEKNQDIFFKKTRAQLYLPSSFFWVIGCTKSQTSRII